MINHESHPVPASYLTDWSEDVPKANLETMRGLGSPPIHPAP